MRYVFKVFYIGENYNGFQRQPHGNTVEDKLERAFQQAGLIRSFKESDYRSSSRTDAKVNALANVILLDVNEEPNLFVVNSYLPRDGSVLVWAKAQVAGDFRLKPSRYKTYRYVFHERREEVLDRLDRIYEFEGEHDFAPFIRRDKVARPTVCRIHSIYYEIDDDRVSIEVTGDHFGWEMIRRMIGFLTDKRYLDMRPSEVLQGEVNIPLHPAPGRHLTLVHVGLPEEPEWEVSNLSKLVRRISEHRREHISGLEDQLKLLSDLSRMLSGGQVSRQGSNIRQCPNEKS